MLPLPPPSPARQISSSTSEIVDALASQFASQYESNEYTRTRIYCKVIGVTGRALRGSLFTSSCANGKAHESRAGTVRVASPRVPLKFQCSSVIDTACAAISNKNIYICARAKTPSTSLLYCIRLTVRLRLSYTRHGLRCVVCRDEYRSRCTV